MKRALYFWLARRMRTLDFSGVYRVADILGHIMWLFLVRRRKATVERIRHHLNVSDREAVRIAKASFINTARSFMEIFLNDKFSMEHVHVERPDLLQEMTGPGRPGVLATAHFGSWELLGAILSRTASRPTMTVARKQKDPVVSELIRELRGESKITSVDHRSAAGPSLECMRKGGTVGFLLDHNASRKEAIFLPFFNDVAAVNMGPALLAVRVKALVYPVFLRRDSLRRYTLIIGEPLDVATLEGSLSEKVRQIAEFYTGAVEDTVRACPEQWLWMHNRWKTRPE